MADYILYGLDDNVLDKTKTYLEEYSEEEIIEALNTLKSLSNLLKAN